MSVRVQRLARRMQLSLRLCTAEFRSPKEYRMLTTSPFAVRLSTLCFHVRGEEEAHKTHSALVLLDNPTTHVLRYEMAWGDNDRISNVVLPGHRRCEGFAYAYPTDFHLDVTSDPIRM